ncbi:MAG: leucine-rich repeat domain-containing protein [Prochloraceae cyanobacterium]
MIDKKYKQLNLNGLGKDCFKEIYVDPLELKQLDKLDLSSKELATLPDPLIDLINLHSLNLAYNKLKNLPEYLKTLTNLAWLNLSYNQLVSIPESLGNLTNLTHLNLDKNKLTVIPKNLGDLINLTELYLKYNQLVSIPESLGNLTNLTHLNLSCNQLVSIPESLGNLTNLSVLYLDNNQLNDLPESFKNFSNLTTFYFNDNKFNNLPKSISGFSKLEWVNRVKISEECQGIPLGNWPVEWLLESENAEARRLLIQVIGYDRICNELGAIELDRWREYSLLKIEQEVDIESIHLLKMTCPSSGHIHVLRVPPDITKAREAIKWVNWGIDPEEFDIET